MPDLSLSSFLKYLAVIPSYESLFGNKASASDILPIVKKYSIGEWLSYLARLQLMLAANHAADPDRVSRVIAGTVSMRIRKKLGSFKTEVPGFNFGGLYYERQISTLQQLAVLHAPETSTNTLESELGRDDLTVALLMTRDVMSVDTPIDGDISAMLPLTVQEQIRMAPVMGAVHAARVLYFYELDKINRSPAVTTYLQLFQDATGVDAESFIAGGLDIMVREECRSLDQVAEGWHPCPRPSDCTNKREALALAAYQGIRKGTISELRDRICEHENVDQPRDWNLIALSQMPLSEFSDSRVFSLNHTALGRSLFDGVRHEILTAALQKKLRGKFNDQRTIGSLYGHVFEQYIVRLLEGVFGDRLYRIPQSEKELRADCLIWYPERILLIEIKSDPFVARNHAAFLTVEERRDELTKKGIPKAVRQLASTIRALRNMEVGAPDMPEYDWTITPIIPAVITEERFPQVYGCWDAFYQELQNPIAELQGAGPVQPLRMLNIDDVETLVDLENSSEVGKVLLRWGADQGMKELTLGQFLESKEIRQTGSLMRDRYWGAMRFLSNQLGLDASKLRRPDAK